MTLTSIELMQMFLASGVFGIVFLPPGFLAGYLLNVFGFRRQRLAEQALWSLVLSVPLALLLAQDLGRWMRIDRVFWVFCVMALVAGIVAVRGGGERGRGAPEGIGLVVFAALLLCLYVPLATLDVQVGSRVFVPSVITDWSVRLPMVHAAEWYGVPPRNPLSAVSGVAAPLRYYYFWYVLCAAPARALHLPPIAILAGSATWSGLALLAAALLSLKYLAGERDLSRRKIGCLLLAFSVIGLDLVHILADRLKARPHPLPDIEWWRPDRSPGFRTSVLNGPHHVAGLVCCLIALLLLVESGAIAEAPDVAGRTGEMPRGARLAMRSLLAGCAFAACVGTSTFLALVFATICTIWGLDMLRTRRLRLLATLLGTGLVAWALSHVYLRELRTGTSAAHGFASLTLRSSAGAHGFLAAHHLFQQHPAIAFAARGSYEIVYALLELGFFGFVLLDRFRGELLPALRQQRPLSLGQKVLWIVLGGAGLNALFVSSAVTQSANDLGLHSAVVVRLVLVLWSVPFLSQMFGRSSASDELGRGRLGRPLRWAAFACLLCGLLGEADNVFTERFYYPLMERGAMRGPIQQLMADRLSYRLADIRAAWLWIDENTPPGARLQFDPGGLLGPAYAYFSNRQIVAMDPGCGTAFGGDPSLCPPLVHDLRLLYGGFPAEERLARENDLPAPPRPEAAAGEKDFQLTCVRDHLQYVFADASDPAWGQHGSWIWSGTPVFSSRSVRLFACPGP